MAEAANSTGARILVVDDEANIRTLIKKYAQYEGYGIVEAVNGIDAIAKCRAEDFDLIVMDVMMPELDGFSAVREIRKNKNIPVIMLSARGEKEPFRADKAARVHFETTTQRKYYTILFQNLQEDSDRFFRICHLHNFRAVRCAFCTMRKIKKPVGDGLFGFIRSIYIRPKQSFYAPKIAFASFSSEATMASAPSRVGAQALR